MPTEPPARRPPCEDDQPVRVTRRELEEVRRLLLIYDHNRILIALRLVREFLERE